MARASKKVTRILQIGMHDQVGGVENFLMNYYQNIDKKKIQFDFVCPYKELCYEEKIKQLGGKIYKIPSPKRRIFSYYHSLKKIIHDNGYTIIHINMLSAANILPIIVAKKCGVKRIILHSHSSSSPNTILRKFLNKFNRIFLKYGTDYWACSKKAGTWLFGTRLLTKNKLIIIPNAIDTNKFQFDLEVRNSIRKNLEIEENYVLGHVGRFSKEKNHIFLIHMFERYYKSNKNAKLLLVGDGVLKEEMQRIVKKFGLENAVLFVGNTDNVASYLNAMDVFLLPSLYEGLPLTGIEAQMNGLPALFSDNITREVDISNNCSFLDLQYSDWIKCIEKVKNRRKCFNNKFLDFYDIKNAANDLIEKYCVGDDDV